MDPYAAALKTIRAVAGEWVELRRGAVRVRVRATVGSTMFRIDTDERTNVVIHSVDFFIAAADYRFAGVQAEPLENDLITRTICSRRETHELLKFGDEPCWRWADPAHTEIRAHTKLVATS